jgi:tRNA threonylcarbamoyl adenosine modification protein YjeE
MAKEYVELNDMAQNFYDRFLPGPFTVISKSLNKVAQGLEAENNTQGVRIPNNEWIIGLVKAFGKPITSTSANQSYQKTPYTIDDILDNIPQKSRELIDLIVDGGKLPYNPPSTVIDTTLGEMQVLRKGSIIPENASVNEFTSNGQEETIAFGKELLEKYKENLKVRPLIFALQGDLGAGKTHFTKGIAQAMGITNSIQSPTFILSREYKSPNGNMLYHIDTWRLETESDFDLLGFDKMIQPSKNSNGNLIHNVIIVEWADKIISKLTSLDVNHKILWVNMQYDEVNQDMRTIKWSE